MTDFNPYLPPTASVEDRTFELLEPANRWTRFWAKLLDALISFGGIGIISAIAIPAMLAAKRNGPPSLTTKMSIVIFGLLFLSYVLGMLALNLVWLSRYGQTIGKRICKIKIVRTDGSPVGIGRIIGLRWLPITFVGVIPLLGPLCTLTDTLLIFRKSHQCLHDQIADTLVINS